MIALPPATGGAVDKRCHLLKLDDDFDIIQGYWMETKVL